MHADRVRCDVKPTCTPKNLEWTAQIEFMDDEVQIVRRFLSEEEYSFLMRFSANDDPYFHIRNHFRHLPEYIEWVCHTGERLGESLHLEWSRAAC